MGLVEWMLIEYLLHRNEKFWFGVTAPLVDYLFATYRAITREIKEKFLPRISDKISLEQIIHAIFLVPTSG